MTRTRPAPRGCRRPRRPAVSGLMIWRGVSVPPDYLLLIVVPVAVLSGRFLGFLRDWVPFVALFLGYEAVRGIAPKAGFPRHCGFVIRLDKVMSGGVVPSQWLRAHLGSLRWLAVACTVVYFCHFVIPIGVGMVLWLVDRVQFLRFTVALLAMSFAGFVVFLILPVAPPWLAEPRSGQCGGRRERHRAGLAPHYGRIKDDRGVILGGIITPWRIGHVKQEVFRDDSQCGRGGPVQDRHHGAPFGPDLELLAGR